MGRGGARPGAPGPVRPAQAPRPSRPGAGAGPSAARTGGLLRGRRLARKGAITGDGGGAGARTAAPGPAAAPPAPRLEAAPTGLGAGRAGAARPAGSADRFDAGGPTLHEG